ncbi:hypothetical protein DFH07DRAFT_779061 [Mycena maculata]|uniref:Uncharacterized protein n=1 Tax=Mycena maculata TaxID=230809 RepID=A0AAD7IBL8_9AGAR|nr:hypothetical protein DFH07DRAFT_779061 [Mycena maculata]
MPVSSGPFESAYRDIDKTLKAKFKTDSKHCHLWLRLLGLACQWQGLPETEKQIPKMQDGRQKRHNPQRRDVTSRERPGNKFAPFVHLRRLNTCIHKNLRKNLLVFVSYTDFAGSQGGRTVHQPLYNPQSPSIRSTTRSPTQTARHPWPQKDRDAYKDVQGAIEERDRGRSGAWGGGRVLWDGDGEAQMVLAKGRGEFGRRGGKRLGMVDTAHKGKDGRSLRRA